MASALYVPDTSVFTQAAKVYYAFDIAPAFWRQIVEQAEKEHLHSIDRVHNEILRYKEIDKLMEWANSEFSPHFYSTEAADILEVYASIMRWAQEQTQYLPKAKRELANHENTDAWLVAYCKARGCTLVTQEVYSQEAKAKIPLPNVCKAFGVECTDTFSMMRLLGIRLG